MIRAVGCSVMLVFAVVGCGGGDADPCANHACECTPVAQAVTGTVLTTTEVALQSSQPPDCSGKLLAGSADVTTAFPNHDAPAEVTAVDFSVDRVVLALSNPAIEFFVDDGTTLVLGEEELCQGVAPQCTAYIVHGTTRATVHVATCPYTGPDPCLAP